MRLLSSFSKNLRSVSFIVAICTLVACGGSSSSSEKENLTDASISDSKSAIEEITVEQLSNLVCDDNPSRMDAEAELYTKESWLCERKGESVRIDIYGSGNEQSKANQVVLDFYKTSGDPRGLSDLPLICGSKWAIGVDFNETRDTVIALLSANGFEASTCK